MKTRLGLPVVLAPARVLGQPVAVLKHALLGEYARVFASAVGHETRISLPGLDRVIDGYGRAGQPVLRSRPLDSDSIISVSAGCYVAGGTGNR